MVTQLNSCSEVIIYEYKGVAITRVEKNADIYFYYGNHINHDFPNSFIKAHYSGFNSGMNAYIIFENNKKIKLIPINGFFETVGVDKNSKLKLDDRGIHLFEFEKTIKNKYDNVISISNLLVPEKEDNFKNHSNVKATYPY